MVMRVRMRRCFIHIGTHKTGTTSLQHALHANRRKLDALSYLYPRSGRLAIAREGHHNIAWELSRDRRFRRRFGTVDKLLTEIAATPHDVVLSSEDFGSSVYHAEEFASFVTRLKRLMLDITLIVYFRNQIDYAKSLYLELLAFGFDVSFGEFLTELTDHGRFVWRDWIFPFDYYDFFERLRSIDGVTVVARSYDVTRAALIDDFCSILGLAAADLIAGEEVRRNAQIPSVKAITQYYHNSTRGRWPRPAERAALISLSRWDELQFDMTRQSKLRLIERFAATNVRLSQLTGIPVFDSMRPERLKSDGGKNVFMENIFSSDLVELVNERMSR